MKSRAKMLSDVYFTANGKPRITFELPSRSPLSELEGLEDVSIEVKKYHKRRSLDQNAMAWAFIDKLSERLNISKNEVYRNCIREIGGTSETFCMKKQAVDKFCKEWSRDSRGRHTETFESKIEGCTNVTVYYGSSSFDTETMSRFIDNIIQDCKAVGIDTTPLSEAALCQSR